MLWISGFIFALRNFSQIFELKRNFSVILEFISVIFSIVNANLGFKFKLVQNFLVIFTKLTNLFLVIY